jgi:site-specific DNA-methyltransferase (adenine-specific)
MCVKLHGREKVKLVLDPFLGIGSTAVACRRMGVGMVGFDIDETYLRTARDQLMKKSKDSPQRRGGTEKRGKSKESVVIK